MHALHFTVSVCLCLSVCLSLPVSPSGDSFAGPGEIKRREVVLDPQVSPEEIKSGEVELGSGSWTDKSNRRTTSLMGNTPPNHKSKRL